MTKELPVCDEPTPLTSKFLVSAQARGCTALALKWQPSPLP